MKTLFTSFLLFAVINLSVTAQTTTASTVSFNKPISVSENEIHFSNEKGVTTFQYMTGSEKFPQYGLKICNFTDTGVNPIPKKVFLNGKSAPILQVYVMNKIKYVGGILENEKGKTTTITDITLIESGNTLLFTVTGKSFSMSFTLEKGSMLREEESVTVFNTDGVGIWKVNKKK